MTILEFETIQDLLRSYESDLMVLEEANGNTALFNGKSKTKIANLADFTFVDTQATLDLVEKREYFLYFFLAPLIWNGVEYKKDWYRYVKSSDSFEPMNVNTVNELNGTIASGNKKLEIILPKGTTYITSYGKKGNKIVPVETQLIEATPYETGKITFELFDALDYDIECKVKLMGSVASSDNKNNLRKEKSMDGIFGGIKKKLASLLIVTLVLNNVFCAFAKDGQTVTSPFTYEGASPLDTKMYFDTLEELENYPDKYLSTGSLTYVDELGYYVIYDKENGIWSEFKDFSTISEAIVKLKASDNKIIKAHKQDIMNVKSSISDLEKKHDKDYADFVATASKLRASISELKEISDKGLGVVIASLNELSKRHDKELDNIKATISELEKKTKASISELEKNIKASISEVKASVSELDKRVKFNLASISQLIKDFFGLNKKVDKNYDDYVATISNIKASVSELVASLSELESKHDADIKGIKSSLSELYKRVENYDNLEKLEDYLYYVEYSNNDDKYAYNFLKNEFKHNPGNSLYRGINRGLCSAVEKDGIFGKNLDWTYDNTLGFVVRQKANDGKYASIGYSGGIPQFMKDNLPSIREDEWKILPYMTNFGKNEKGIFVGLNVVPVNEVGMTPTTGTNEGKPDMCAMAIPKYVLDYADDIDEIIDDLSENWNIYCPYGNSMNEEVHIMIGDGDYLKVIEFINNGIEVIDLSTTNHKYMTNFYLHDASFDMSDGKVDYTTVTPHGAGIQRSYDLVDGLETIENEEDMMRLLQNELKYTNAYDLSREWRDEFTGDYSSIKPEWGDLTVSKALESPSDFNGIMSYEIGEYNNRNRATAKTWQTVASGVMSGDIMQLVVQEQGLNKTYSFSINGNDYVNKYQGYANKNKILIVDENGYVAVADQVKVDLSTVSEAIEELKASVSDAEERIEALENKVVDLSTVSEAIENNRASISELAERHDEDINIVNEHIEASVSELVENHNKDITLINKHFKASVSELRASISELGEKHKFDILDILQKIADLFTIHKNDKKELVATISQVRASISEVKASVSQLQIALANTYGRVKEVNSLPNAMDIRQEYLYKIVGINSLYWYNGIEWIDFTSKAGMISVDHFPTGGDIQQSFLYMLTKDATRSEVNPITGKVTIIVDYYAGVYAYVSGSWKALWSRVATVDYNDVTNRPKINGTEIYGEKSSSDYNIYPKEIADATFQSKVATLSSFSSHTVLGIIDELDKKVSVTFKPKGTVDYIASLSQVTSKTNGDVYIVRWQEDPDNPGEYIENFISYWWNDEKHIWEKFGANIDYTLYQKLNDKIDYLKTANPTISWDANSVSAVNDNFTLLRASGVLNTPIRDIQSADRKVVKIPSELKLKDGKIMVRVKTVAGQITAMENVSSLPSSGYNDLIRFIDPTKVITLNTPQGTKYAIEQDFNRNGKGGGLYWEVENSVPAIKTSMTVDQIGSGKTVYKLVNNPTYNCLGTKDESVTDFDGTAKTIKVPLWEVEQVNIAPTNGYALSVKREHSGLNVDTNGVYGHYSHEESAESKQYSSHYYTSEADYSAGFAGTYDFTPYTNISSTQFVNNAYVKTDSTGQWIYIQGDITVSEIFIDTIA